MDIYIIGSTIERTRLYRMAIGVNIEELSQIFDIYALTNEEWILFTKIMETEAFLIIRAKNLLLKNWKKQTEFSKKHPYQNNPGNFNILSHFNHVAFFM